MLSSLDNLMDDIWERFGESEYEDSLAALTWLQQTSTVVVYIAEFERIFNDVSGMMEKSLISFIVRELREDL